MAVIPKPHESSWLLRKQQEPLLNYQVACIDVYRPQEEQNHHQIPAALPSRVGSEPGGSDHLFILYVSHLKNLFDEDL